jgi:hypothetical protein
MEIATARHLRRFGLFSSTSATLILAGVYTIPGDRQRRYRRA